MWRGSIIDKIMELEIMPRIKNKQSIDYEYIAELAIGLAKRQFAFSESRLYQQKENSESKVGSDYCILEIHHHSVPYNNDDLENVYRSVREIILGIPTIQMPDGSKLVDFLSTASLVIPNMKAWSFEFENIVINPQLDLFMIVKNKAIVLDWKVSESSVSDYSRQLVIGGITVFDTYRKKAASGNGRRLGFNDIRLIEVNLYRKDVKEHEFNEQVVNECIDFIYVNGDDIARLTDGNGFDALDITDFPITDKESTCVFCKFRSLCIDQLTSKKCNDETKYSNNVQDQEPEQLKFFF
jgi:hypothetical protein